MRCSLGNEPNASMLLLLLDVMFLSILSAFSINFCKLEVGIIRISASDGDCCCCVAAPATAFAAAPATTDCLLVRDSLLLLLFILLLLLLLMLPARRR